MGQPFLFKKYLPAGIVPMQNQTEIKPQNNLVVFPNPSTGIFTIKNDNISSPINFEVYNMLGEMILQKQNSTEIDLSNAVKGIYFVKITIGTKNYTEKIVVH